LASVEDRLNTLDVEPDTKGTVVAGLVDGSGASRKLELSYGDVTKALIQYCRAHQIPLPRYDDKQLAPAGDGMALMVRMVFSRPDRPASSSCRNISGVRRFAFTRRETRMPKIAVLDDYQHTARTMADWTALGSSAEVTVFNDHEADESALARRLADFDVICVMRERTPMPRTLIERLPNLRLLVTTGARNASIDMEAATEKG